MLDVIVIGAGIIGSLIAYDLSKYNLSIRIIDKAEDVACGATMANSAIVHAGYDPDDGTLKALLNVKGARMYESLCKDLSCHFDRIGSYVLAKSDEECELLKKLAKQCEQRGISYELHNRDEIDEPNLSDEVLLGLYCKETAIITPWEVAIAAVETAMDNGASLGLNEEVLAIEEITEGYRITTNLQVYESRMVINCAGVHSDEVQNLIYPTSVEVKGKRGEYFVLDHPKETVVKHVIYPVPSSKGKGVLVLPTVHHNILVGPTSDFVEDKEDVATTQRGLDEVRSKASSLICNLPMHTIIRTYAGNRPSGSKHDFVIECLNKGFVSCVGIESPGIASAPAISEYVLNLLKKDFVFEKKETYYKRRKPVIMSELSVEQRNELIHVNPAYGRIICRCEKISEGEILDCIQRNAGATTIKGVKKRVRAGMGRCQGGFCESRVVGILARELKKDETEICLGGQGSNVLLTPSKEVSYD